MTILTNEQALTLVKQLEFNDSIYSNKQVTDLIKENDILLSQILKDRGLKRKTFGLSDQSLFELVRIANFYPFDLCDLLVEFSKRKMGRGVTLVAAQLSKASPKEIHRIIKKLQSSTVRARSIFTFPSNTDDFFERVELFNQLLSIGKINIETWAADSLPTIQELEDLKS